MTSTTADLALGKGLSPAGAYRIASQWGSRITNDDPGAIFYTFPVDDARPESEAHRLQLVAYVDVLTGQRVANPCRDMLEQAVDLGALAALRDFFTHSELRP